MENGRAAAPGLAPYLPAAMQGMLAERDFLRNGGVKRTAEIEEPPPYDPMMYNYNGHVETPYEAPTYEPYQAPCTSPTKRPSFPSTSNR